MQWHFSNLGKVHRVQRVTDPSHFWVTSIKTTPTQQSGTGVDELLIPEQAGFRPGKSTTNQVLNLTQFIEDGFEEGKVTDVVFGDLSATYDTVNHRLLLHKIMELTNDIRLTELFESMHENRFFFAELESKKSRWRNPGIAYHREVYSHRSFSTFIPMTNQEVQTRANWSLQVTSV